MKLIILAVVVFLLPSMCLGQKSQTCPANTDVSYNRGAILQKLADALKNSIPEKYKTNSGNNFRVRDERAVLFFVHDLTDVSNKQMRSTESINFIERHIYHFASPLLPFSFSHIVFLEGGNLKIFSVVNCQDMGDKLEDATNYLEKQLKNDKDKDQILKRVKEYRRYGVYVADIDDEDLRCQEVKYN
jgi:hypothetical protein